MPDSYFKYKGLTLSDDGDLDARTLQHVIEPIGESYFYLPTREKLNDPNEGIFINQIQAGINGFLRGVAVIGEINDLKQAFYHLAHQIGQSTDNSGVFSLSGNVTDELLWAHYAASHHGIAIEYDLAQLTRFCPKPLLNCFPVSYVESPPQLDFHHLQEDPQQAIFSMLGHKSPRWSYEDEFRVLLESNNGRMPHDYRAVKSITFGLKVQNEIQEQIFHATKHKVPKYYQVCKIQDSYRLEIKQLEHFEGTIPTGVASNINWPSLLTGLEPDQKARIIELMITDIENDPHFKELYNADISTNDRTKAYLQYESEHHIATAFDPHFTKHYYEL
jgi:hypothetical protein